MLHLFRFDPEQQRLFETKSITDLQKSFVWLSMFKKDQHFDSSTGELAHGEKMIGKWIY